MLTFSHLPSRLLLLGRAWAWCSHLGILKLVVKHRGLGTEPGFLTLGTVDILG